MTDWKYNNLFDAPEPGLHKQEHITYRHDAIGNLVKKTVTRMFYDGDYQDSVKTEVICACKRS